MIVVVHALLFASLLGEPVSMARSVALSVELASDLACPAPTAIMDALRARLAPLRVERGVNGLAPFQLALTAPAPHGLALTLRERGTILVARTLSVQPHECSGLADTVALIAEAWMRAPQVAEESAGPRLELSDAPLPASAPVEGVVAAPPAPAARAVPVRALPELDIEAGGRSAGAVVRSNQERRDEAGRSAGSPLRHLALELAVGAVVAPAVANASLRAGLEVAHGRWLAAARGHVESASAIGELDAITLRRSPLELLVGGVLTQSSLLQLALLLGAGVDVVAARARSYENGGLSRSFVPLAASALRAAFLPHASIRPFVAAELVVSLRRERYVSAGELIAESERARSRLLIGASWHVF